MNCVKFPSSGPTLASPNLSHMDFPDDPAGFPRSELIISDTTQDESSNELINPEKLMKNRPIPPYCFLVFGSAIFLDTVKSSCACIVLLSEASSSSHFTGHCVVSLGPERSIFACLMSSNHEFCQISVKWTDLGLAQSFSYGFS